MIEVAFHPAAEVERLVPGFPFTIIYRIWEDHFFVVAVAHQHRRPGYWRGRTVANTALHPIGFAGG